MDRPATPDPTTRTDAGEKQPSELTAIAPDFSGKVTNRPKPEGPEAIAFNRAAEEERQADA